MFSRKFRWHFPSPIRPFSAIRISIIPPLYSFHCHPSTDKVPDLDRRLWETIFSLSCQNISSESCKHSHHQPSAAPASSPPVPSVGEAPGMDRLIPGAGFLLARRRMRWRAADTCLSAASCVRSSPPLAFFCGVRGTLPESRSVQARSLTGAYLPTL